MDETVGEVGAQASKWSKLSGLFHRRPNAQIPRPEPIAEIPQKEAQRNPEELRDEISQDLGSLADIQLRVARAKDELESFKHSNPDSNYLNKVKERADAADLHAAATALVAKMKGAQSVLGDVCGVIKEGDHEGVVILSPGRRQVVQSVVSVEGKVLFTKKEDVVDIYYVNKYGLCRMTIPIARTLDANPESLDARRDEKYIREVQTDSAKEVVDYRDDAMSAIDSAIVDSNPDRGEAAVRISGRMRELISGSVVESQVQDDRIEPLAVRESAYFHTRGDVRFQRVTTGELAQEALTDSIDQARKKRSQPTYADGAVWRRDHLYMYVDENRL